MIFSKVKYSTYYFALFLVFLLLNPAYLKCEFYEYIDKNGVRVFTDDPSLIPNYGVQQGTTKTYKEKYDHLDETQKNALIQKEQEEIAKLKNETRAVLERYEQQEEAERKKQQEKQREIERQNRLKALRTPITFSQGGGVLVPVTIKYSNKEITISMLLDTGASITTIDQSVAEELDIKSGKKSAAMVAGGGIVRTKIVEVEQIKVGPKFLNTHKIMVFLKNNPRVDFQGLLGQNFLRQFDYSIDYGSRSIQWKK